MQQFLIVKQGESVMPTSKIGNLTCLVDLVVLEEEKILCYEGNRKNKT
jgi:hypothetical protein